MNKPAKWLPHDTKCDYTTCKKQALKENTIKVGNHFLYYCKLCFAQVAADMIRPGGPNSTKGITNWKNQPRPLYATPTPQPKKWNQPKSTQKHKIETRRTAWEKEFIKLSKKIKQKQKKEAKK